MPKNGDLGGGGTSSPQLQASQRWLDLLPWSSPELDRERRLHAAGRLAHDLGASDLVPLQLRLRLGGGDVGSSSSSSFSPSPPDGGEFRLCLV